MKRHHRYAVCLLSLFLLHGSHAKSLSNADDEEKSPLGCRDLGYEYNLHVIHLTPLAAGESQSLYLFFNRLSKPVNLYQMMGDNSTISMSLNHTIQPRQWSVLSAGEKNFNYICTLNDSTSRYGKVLDCADSVKVCQYARVKYGMNNRGNFWMVGSTSRNAAVNGITHYGVIPR